MEKRVVCRRSSVIALLRECYNGCRILLFESCSTVFRSFLRQFYQRRVLHPGLRTAQRVAARRLMLSVSRLIRARTGQLSLKIENVLVIESEDRP